MSLERKQVGKCFEKKVELHKKVRFDSLSVSDEEEEEEMKWCASEFPELGEV